MRKLVRFLPAVFVMIVSFGAHAVTCYNGVYCSNISTSTTGTPVTSIPTGTTGNKVYTAKWTPINYQIKYELNGGTGATDTNYTVETDTITLPTASRMNKVGYTFAGWYDNSGLNGTAVTKVDKGSTGNKTFYAKWTPNTFNVTIVANGGTPDGTVPTKCTYGTPCVLPTYTKAGYTFGGWKCS